MLWIVQDNLHNEYGYQRFLDAMQTLGCEYLVVKPVPMTNILLPEDFDSATMEVEDAEEVVVPTDRKVVVFGSTTLSRIAQDRGWTPGTYLNANFDYAQWKAGFGSEHLLNSDAVVTTIGEAVNLDLPDQMFLRPTADTKAFAGTVMRRAAFLDWQAKIAPIPEEEFTPLHVNTEIVISSPKEIYNECRVFVVDGRIVASSLYKQGHQVIASARVPEAFLTFAQAMVDRWQPAPAFVIDIAQTADGFKVIEINNLNSAGYYEADVTALVEAIQALEDV